MRSGAGGTGGFATSSHSGQTYNATFSLRSYGSGGGHDQGMAWAKPLAQQGVRVIAVSRFGYLRTPRPPGA